MKASELHSCDSCGGQLAGRMPDGRAEITFHVVRISMALLIPHAVNQHIGLATMFGGSPAAHRLAEVMSPDPEIARVIGDERQHGGEWDEALICSSCFMATPRMPLAMLAEAVANRKRGAHEKAEADRG